MTDIDCLISDIIAKGQPCPASSVASLPGFEVGFLG